MQFVSNTVNGLYFSVRWVRVGRTGYFVVNIADARAANFATYRFAHPAYRLRDLALVPVVTPSAPYYAAVPTHCTLIPLQPALRQIYCRATLRGEDATPPALPVCYPTRPATPAWHTPTTFVTYAFTATAVPPPHLPAPAAAYGLLTLPAAFGRAFCSPRRGRCLQAYLYRLPAAPNPPHRSTSYAHTALRRLTLLVLLHRRACLCSVLTDRRFLDYTDAVMVW